MPDNIDTPAKRAKLRARRNPYWQSIAGGRGGVSLGYRRAQSGAGTWVAKTIKGGRRAEERLGVADDVAAPAGAIDFKAAVQVALEWSGRQRATFASGNGAASEQPTIRSAVEEYIAQRRKALLAGGDNASGRLVKHVLADDKLAALKLAKLTASDIQEWIGRVVGDDLAGDGAGVGQDEEEGPRLALTTVNRLLNDFRAALNSAAMRHRRLLPAHIVQEIRLGTKRLDASSNARRQILTDAQVVALVNAAFEVDETGDFGRLTTLLAATGARHSQARIVRVGDFQHNLQRVMMPGAKKGRSRRAKPPVARQLSGETCARLLPAAEGRDVSAPLLERWYFSQKGHSGWERAGRRAWGPAYEVDRYWPETVKRAGVPADTVMYAFRHSSIVRGLRANLPVRLVASLHDTSIEMIEAHYSAYIVDATEDLARRAVLALSPVG